MLHLFRWTAPPRKPKATEISRRNHIGIAPPANPESLPSRVRWFFGALCVANLLGVLLLWLLVDVVADRWWVSMVLAYVPKKVFVLPSVALLCGIGVSRILRRPRYDEWGQLLSVPQERDARLAESRNLKILLATLLVISGPLMGFELPWGRITPDGPSGTPLTVMTYNVANYCPDFDATLLEITQVKPDIVALQEADGRPHPKLVRYFRDWHTVHVDEFFVASRYPVRVLEIWGPEPLRRETAMAVEVSGPDGPFVIVNVHTSSFRPALEKLFASTLAECVDGRIAREINDFARVRSLEMAETSGFARKFADRPLAVVGDFNTPTSTLLYRQNWSMFTNAFETAGWGYGYSAPNVGRPHIPGLKPWLRIDHVLVNSHLAVKRCRYGRGEGSDHRPVIATLALRQPPEP